MNQPVDPTTGKGAMYEGTVDCIIKTVRAEGMRGLYKGLMPAWYRLGVHTSVTFLAYERLRGAAGYAPV